MKYYRLTLEYDGTNFSGWQIQPHRRTVQGEICRVLRDLSAGEVKVTGAGRTDAGAHAAGQVAGVSMETNHHTPTLRKAISAKLPSDIVLKDISPVAASFNARYGARSKTYRYIFKRGRTALWRKRFYSVTGDLKIRRMRRAVKQLSGRKDFTAFSTAGGDAGEGICRVISSEIREVHPLIIFEITADRFLYNMVRRISGSLLWIGQGRQIDIRNVIESGDRSRSPNILPAYALYLMKVHY